MEIINGSSKIILVSMYFDREIPIEIDLGKTEKLMQHAKGAGVLTATDSNSRSTLWHDTLTNTRGRILEEFITSKQLHIMNKEGSNTTFRNRIGASNIDLTIVNNQLLRRVSGWEISDQESSSDHSIIKYAISESTSQVNSVNFQDVRYITKKETLAKFQVNILQIVETNLCKQTNGNRTEDLDDTLCSRLSEDMAIGKHIDKFSEALKLACNKSFKTQRASKMATTRKSVPWWMEYCEKEQMPCGGYTKEQGTTTN